MDGFPYTGAYRGGDEFINELWKTEYAKTREVNETERRAQDRLTLAAKEMLETASGRRFLFWLLNRTGVFASSFTGNSSTFFLEGKRSIGIELYRLLLSADPGAIHTLITFQKNEEHNDAGNE